MPQLALLTDTPPLTLAEAQALAAGLTQVQAQALRDALTPEERLRLMQQFAGYAKDMARQHPGAAWRVRLIWEKDGTVRQVLCVQEQDVAYA